ncbi:MAG: enolase C-terminal domain-like protein [Crocinitomicaceae bacterium]
MQEQIEQKLAAGFTTIKMKIGAIDFDTEYRLLKSIRQQFDQKTITLRVDANRLFSPQEAKNMYWNFWRNLTFIPLSNLSKPGNGKQCELCARSYSNCFRRRINWHQRKATKN